MCKITRKQEALIRTLAAIEAVEHARQASPHPSVHAYFVSAHFELNTALVAIRADIRLAESHVAAPRENGSGAASPPVDADPCQTPIFPPEPAGA